MIENRSNPARFGLQMFKYLTFVETPRIPLPGGLML
jgi:hypothetical protein